MTRCAQCRHFIKTYEDEGWCSHPKYSGFVAVQFNEERCQGHGFVKENESRLSPPVEPAKSLHTPSQ